MKLWDTTWLDRLAIWLSIGGGVMAMASGILALLHRDYYAACFGILSGVFTAGGVIAAYRGSKVRDNQLNFWIKQLADGLAESSRGFGG